MKTYFKATVLGAALAIGAGFVSPAKAETFRWAFQSSIGGLDGMSTGDGSTRNFLRNIYESLTRFNPDMKIEGALAESWTLTSDTVWRFKLRPNVVFHGGEKFTADDVLFSFRRATASSSDIRPRLFTVKDIRKVDDLTVDIETKAPSPTLLNDLTFMDVFSQSWATKNNAIEPILASTKAENYATRNANGTGPFKIAKFDPATSVELVPNEKWWDSKKHNITRAIFTGISTDSTRVAALLSGQVDMVFPLPQQDAARVSASANHQVIAGPEDRVIFLGMDQARDELLYSNIKGKNPFKDKRVRQAVYQAIDTKLIGERVMRGSAMVAGSLVNNTAFGWHPSLDERFPFDVAAARKLMADAGYPNGFTVTMDCPTDRYVNDEQICIAIVSMLAQIGVKVDLLAQSRNPYFAKIGKRDTSFYLHGWGSGTDAQSIMQLLMHSPTERAGSWNSGGYQNPKVDELIVKIGSEMNRDKRQAMFKEAFDIHRNDIGVIPIHRQVLIWGVSKKVSVKQRADDYLDLNYVRIGQASQ
jgi:peptide/nickel transport system substrate-binding protein